jgi:hypothetical protein
MLTNINIEELRKAGSLGKMKATGPASSISFNGHPYDEVLSAVQKYIRRGEVEKAVYAAIEADLFSLIDPKAGKAATNAKARRTNFINRLRVIVGEEIGVANPSLLLHFDQLYQEWLQNRESVNPQNAATARRALIKMVTTLAISKKIRLVSDIKAVYFHNSPTVPQEKSVESLFMSCLKNYSDEAFTYMSLIIMEKGGLAAGQSHIYGLLKQHISLLSGQHDAKYIENMNRIMEICERYQYGTSRVWSLRLAGGLRPRQPDIGFSGKRDEWIYVILPVLYVLRVKDLASWNFNAIDMTELSNTITDDQVTAYYSRNLSGQQPLEFDSYVIDMHTRKGKTARKGSVEFAQEGALVVNEELSLLNPKYRAIYISSKGTSNPTPNFSPKVKMADFLPMAKNAASVSTTDLTTKDICEATKEIPIPKSNEGKIFKPLKLPTLKMRYNKVVSTTINVCASGSLPGKLPINVCASGSLPGSNRLMKTDEHHMDTEKTRFTDVLRAQLTCSNNRPDVYFAYDNVLKQRVVVKGPYISEEQGTPLSCATYLNDVKRKLGLPYSTMHVVKLVPDMWVPSASLEVPDKQGLCAVPVGSRNKVLAELKDSNDNKAFFLIMDDLCHKQPLPLGQIARKTHESKCWPPTEVFDIENTPNCSILDLQIIDKLNNKNMKMQMILLYAFRYIYEIVDTTERNFLMNFSDADNCNVYSIDEENFGTGKRKYFVGNRRLAAKDNRRTLFTKFLAELKSDVIDRLNQWLQLIKQNKDECAKMSVTDVNGKESFNVEQISLAKFNISYEKLEHNIQFLITSDIATLLY